MLYTRASLKLKAPSRLSFDLTTQLYKESTAPITATQTTHLSDNDTAWDFIIQDPLEPALRFNRPAMSPTTITGLHRLTKDAQKQMETASVLQEDIRVATKNFIARKFNPGREQPLARDGLSVENSARTTRVLDGINTKVFKLFKDRAGVLVEMDTIHENMGSVGGELAATLQILEEAHHDLDSEVEIFAKALEKLADDHLGWR